MPKMERQRKVNIWQPLRRRGERPGEQKLSKTLQFGALEPEATPASEYESRDCCYQFIANDCPVSRCSRLTCDIDQELFHNKSKTAVQLGIQLMTGRQEFKGTNICAREAAFMPTFGGKCGWNRQSLRSKEELGKEAGDIPILFGAGLSEQKKDPSPNACHKPTSCYHSGQPDAHGKPRSRTSAQQQLFQENCIQRHTLIP
ncbi:Hypothetical predicted protein [Podarcis lilfordi]|uniref:Uncharacterized protein n=1 Tax=Podarcis lilfordi TaxID=74358 RepID=A0AA35PA79_9SAUR|nr:Hypothetical predicted protein [Podarcis lilfordi]